MEENAIIKEEEFTFKKFFALIKRSGKRILIFAIIAAIIGVCLAAIVGVSLLEQKTYSATVEYTHAGIAKGMAPDGGVLNYGDIKSATVVNAALRSMGYSESEISTMSGRVQNALSIAPYVSPADKKHMEDDPTYEPIPSRYIVSLPGKSVSGIKNSKYPELLNKIVEEYGKHFADTYKYKVQVPASVRKDSLDTVTDYYDLVSMYRAQFNTMEATLNATPSNYTAVSTKLIAEVNFLGDYLSTIENYILTRNVQKKGVVLPLRANIDNRRRDSLAKKDAYESQINALSASIENFNKQYDSLIIGSSGTVTVQSADSSQYNELVAQRASLLSLKRTSEENANVLADKLDILVDTNLCTDADREFVEECFDLMYDRYIKTAEQINEELAEYTAVYVLKNGVKIVSNAGVTSSYIGWIAIAATFVLAVLIGIIAAIATTSAIEKKQNKKI